MANPTVGILSRREFVKSAAAGAAAVIAAPTIVTAAKTDSQVVVGTGDHRYEAIHNWPQLPGKFTWQTTHNCTVDRDGLVYIIHEGREPTVVITDRVRHILARGQISELRRALSAAVPLRPARRHDARPRPQYHNIIVSEWVGPGRVTKLTWLG
jgi:anaerobic selenocysteine-containing dehydrogenase